MNINSKYTQYVIWALSALLIFRLITLIFSPLGLHGDEAQYWAWAQSPDWGYFTKPPMIAWLIATTTALFGDAEWAVRLSSPLLHTLTALVIFRTARHVYDTQTGFWAAMIYALMPALWLSSNIVSTDVPLLLCWAVALNAWVHLRDSASPLRASQLGLALGLGLLSKYAMLFFIPPLIIAILFDRPTRQALFSLKGLLSLVIASLLITPNIIWNMTHDFATLSHTAANANLDIGSFFHPSELLGFWIDQLAVFGPVTLILLAIALWAALKRRLNSPAFWLALFTLSPLLIISIEALLSRANANWAVTAYISASILTAHASLILGGRLKPILKIGVLVQSLIGLAAVCVMLSPTLTNQLGLINSVKRLRAWPETVTTLKEIHKAGHAGNSFSAIATDKRIIFYDLKYYGLETTASLHMWMRHAAPQNQAELVAGLEATDGPVLIVNYYSPDLQPGREDYKPFFEDDFDRLDFIKQLNIDLGGGKQRQLKLFAGYGYTPTQSR